MNFTIEHEENYTAEIVEITNIEKAPNSDKLYITRVFGYPIIVDGSWNVGDIAVFFPAETQLSAEYVRINNLSRYPELNADPDPDKTGFIEKNRRVRAIKLRGNVSAGLLMKVSSLGVKPTDIPPVGTQFDTVDGNEICRKYTVKQKQPRAQQQIEHSFSRVDKKFLPEHVETENYLRNAHLFDDEDWFIVTQKLHGTSWRGSNIPVAIKPTWKSRIAKWLGVRVQETEYDYVAGSRKVIKDPNNPNQQSYYDVDIWSEYLSRVRDRIPTNIIIYGELVGWVDENTPIQKDYTYGYAPGERELYVYRVAVIGADTRLYDLSWDQLRGFCKTYGFKHVPELWRGKKKDLALDPFTDTNYTELATSASFPDKPVFLPRKTPDEGVVIRVDRDLSTPLMLKFKSPKFLAHETALLDKGEEDLEEQQK